MPHALLPVNHLIKRAQQQKARQQKAAPPPPPPPKPPVIQPSTSLLKYCTFVYDQGDLGSCTANAFCTAYRVRCVVQNKYTGFAPSRLFFYYNERVMEGTVQEDAGADVVDGEAYVQTNGICSESLWPYNITQYATRPPASCFSAAPQHKIKSFQVLMQTGAALVTAMQTQLNARQPLLIAIAVYDSFMSDSVASTGWVPVPDMVNETCQGGHELCVLGYDNGRQAFQVMNSWGVRWGIHGVCWIPYAYIKNPDLCFEVTLFTV